MPSRSNQRRSARALTSLFTALDLRGWQASDEHKQHWKPRGGSLTYDGNCKAADPHLWTTNEFGNFEMIVDWKLPKKGAGVSGILLRGSMLGQVTIGTSATGSGELKGYRDYLTQDVEVRAAAIPS